MEASSDISNECSAARKRYKVEFTVEDIRAAEGNVFFELTYWIEPHLAEVRATVPQLGRSMYRCVPLS